MGSSSDQGDIDHGCKGSAAGSSTDHGWSEELTAALCRNDNFIQYFYYGNGRTLLCGKGMELGQMMMRPKKLCSREHWKPSEDSKLRALIDIHGPHNWNLIADKLGGRSGKSCRLRWCNQLDPNIIRRAFSEEEEQRLIAAHRMYGNKWSMIARLFPGRTDNSVKNHWHVVMARKHRRLHPTVSNTSRIRKKQIITSQSQTGLISRLIDDQSSTLATCSYTAIAQPSSPNLINSSRLFTGYKRGCLDVPKLLPKIADFNPCERQPSPMMDDQLSINDPSQFSFAPTLASTSQLLVRTEASSLKSTSAAASLVSENASTSSFEKPTHYLPFIDFLGVGAR